MIENSKVKQVVFFVVSMLVLFIVFSVFHDEATTSQKKNRKLTMDYDILTSVEKTNAVGEDIELSGWALRLNSKVIDMQVLLVSTDNSDAERFSVDKEQGTKIGAFFVSDWDFGDCVYKTLIDTKKIKSNVPYEIFLVIEYESETTQDKKMIKKEVKVSTGKFLYENEVIEYNPFEYEKPHITDAELKDVIDDGVVRYYDSKEQIWIYQVGMKLYYFMDLGIESMEQEGYGIPVLVHTTKAELLPEHRKEHGFDHLGFYYENMEYKRDGVYPYLVVVATLSTEYPLTYIDTGFYGNNEKWINNIKLPMAEWSYKQSAQSER